MQLPSGRHGMMLSATETPRFVRDVQAGKRCFTRPTGTSMLEMDIIFITFYLIAISRHAAALRMLYKE
jgi:hypothetical protein